MITTAILEILYLFIYALTSPLRLFSDVSLPAGLTAAISNFNAYISGLDFIFPISTLLAIFILLLTIEGFIFSYKIVMWLIKKIPTVN